MCNKRFGKLGQFLFYIDCNSPEKDAKYFIHWSNKLDVADCDMSLVQDLKTGEDVNMIVSFKNIGINTYNVFVYDLKTKLIKYNFEAN